MSRLVIQLDWHDAPHLSEAEKQALWATTPRYQRDARKSGIPQLGSGAIYPFEQSTIEVEDFKLPPHWPRCFALDAQPLWKSSVVVAWDRDNNTAYIYRVFKRAECEPSSHAAAIQAVGDWIPGVGDASGLVRDAERGRYIDLYSKWLDIELADRRSGQVESGIQEVYTWMSENRLFVFSSCKAWFEEFRSYHRDEKGRIVKKNDHLMDCTRYALATGLQRAKTEPKKRQGTPVRYRGTKDKEGRWMQ